ncbi:MAG: chemotaxis protein CheW [Planctomycetota bacterium]
MNENRAREDLEEELLEDEEEDAQKDKYLTFRIVNEDYAIEIAHVTEIVTAQKITEVPDMPEYLKGVINLRGQVVPVVDVRTRFRLPPRPYDERTCFVVVRLQDLNVGLAVDTVCEVLIIPAAQVSPPPKLSKGPGSRYVKGLGKSGDTVKILLDVGKLLLDAEMEQISALQA